MDGLTKEQQRAVDSGAHALEIRAGAGTGKTTVLAERLARIVREGSPEHRLLAVTFTREATASLSRKLGLRLGKGHGVRVSSFHAWAARELRADELRFINEVDARAIVLRGLQARPSAGLTGAMGGGEDVATRVLGFLSYVRNAETTVGDAVLRQFPALAPWEHALCEIEEHYRARKGDRLDFDDLLILFRDRLAASASFRQEVVGRLDHVAVDEYQDVNQAQADSVRLITAGRGAPGVTVVGDPRQSIYGFRGGSPIHLERFLEPYGRRGARVALTRSFRSTRAIVDAGNAALPDAYPLRPRPRAPAGASPRILRFEDPLEEARGLADQVEALLARGAEPTDVAILCRARPLAAHYVDEVRERRNGIERVPVSTIHAAKGLEWDHVFVVGAREGGIPSDHALRAEADARERLLAEERRLLYVALTRARKTLTVTWPEADARRTFAPCRWLGDLGVEKPRREAATSAKRVPRASA